MFVLWLAIWGWRLAEPRTVARARVALISCTNTGSGELRLVAIHGGSRFVTEWLAREDRTWLSKAR